MCHTCVGQAQSSAWQMCCSQQTLNPTAQGHTAPGRTSGSAFQRSARPLIGAGSWPQPLCHMGCGACSKRKPTYQAEQVLSKQVICRLLQLFRISQATLEHVYIHLNAPSTTKTQWVCPTVRCSHQRGCSARLRRRATRGCCHQHHQGVLAPKACDAARPRCRSAGRPPPGTVPDNLVIRVRLRAASVQDMHAPDDRFSIICIAALWACSLLLPVWRCDVSRCVCCSPGGQLVGSRPQGGRWRREAQRGHRRQRAAVPAALQRQRGATAIVVGVHGRRAGGRQRQRLAAVRPGSHRHVRSRLAVGPARHSSASFSTAVKEMRPEASRIRSSSGLRCHHTAGHKSSQCLQRVRSTAGDQAHHSWGVRMFSDLRLCRVAPAHDPSAGSPTCSNHGGTSGSDCSTL